MPLSREGNRLTQKKKNVDAFIVKKVRPSTHANINTLHAKRRRLTMCLLFVCSINWSFYFTKQ